MWRKKLQTHFSSNKAWVVYSTMITKEEAVSLGGAWDELEEGPEGEEGRKWQNYILIKMSKN